MVGSASTEYSRVRTLSLEAPVVMDTAGDVVILPAFGATLAEMQHLEELGVTTVDTTCPWVTKVWNVVDRQAAKDLTTIIHGKYAHEEAIATASYCKDYIMVKNMDEAEYVCNYILNPTAEGKEDLMRKFAKAMSPGFDPDVHLKKIGIANQTTMYKRETAAIGKLFEVTMIKKYGPEDASQRYAAFDTICDATQERQDAITEMVEDPSVADLDFILVVGGFDSSNTAHLVEIPHDKGLSVYHINEAHCVGANNSVSLLRSITPITNQLRSGTASSMELLSLPKIGFRRTAH